MQNPEVGDLPASGPPWPNDPDVGYFLALASTLPNRTPYGTTLQWGSALSGMMTCSPLFTTNPLPLCPGDSSGLPPLLHPFNPTRGLVPWTNSLPSHQWSGFCRGSAVPMRCILGGIPDQLYPSPIQPVVYDRESTRDPTFIEEGLLPNGNWTDPLRPWAGLLPWVLPGLVNLVIPDPPT